MKEETWEPLRRMIIYKFQYISICLSIYLFFICLLFLVVVAFRKYIEFCAPDTYYYLFFIAWACKLIVALCFPGLKYIVSGDSPVNVVGQVVVII